MYNEKPRRPSHLSTARKPEIGQAHAIIRYSRTFEIRKKKKKETSSSRCRIEREYSFRKDFFFLFSLDISSFSLIKSKAYK